LAELETKRKRKMRRLTQSTPNREANKITERKREERSMRNPPRIGETFENTKKTQLGKEMKQKTPQNQGPGEKKEQVGTTMKTRMQRNQRKRRRGGQIESKISQQSNFNFRIRIRERKVQDKVRKAFSASRKVEKKEVV
jgi:hypothetical protein